MIGTISDTTGYFELDVKGNMSQPLIISFVGYINKNVSVKELSPYSVFKLEKRNLQIQEVEINSTKSPMSRRKMLRIFKKEFLGKSLNTELCRIKNEDDIYLFYNIETEVLHASSRNPIIIINKGLGYQINYLLEFFRKSESGIKYKGYSSFRELPVKNNRQLNSYIDSRNEAYLGSILQFIRYLYNYNISANDTIYDLSEISQKINAYSQNLAESGYDPNTIIKVISENKSKIIFDFIHNDRFQLYDKNGDYKSCSDILVDVDSTRYLAKCDTLKVIYLGTLKKTQMVARLNFVEITKSGFYNPEHIGWYGSMAKNRVGDLLPSDFVYLK